LQTYFDENPISDLYYEVVVEEVQKRHLFRPLRTQGKPSTFSFSVRKIAFICSKKTIQQPFQGFLKQDQLDRLGYGNWA
jgi:hypothetical protein